jgi:hypothetical protein
MLSLACSLFSPSPESGFTSGRNVKSGQPLSDREAKDPERSLEIGTFIYGAIS